MSASERCGVGADDRDRAGGAVSRPAERQHAVVGEQHDRLLGEAPGDVAVARRVEVDLGRRLVVEGVRLEQPELLLLPQGTQHGPVDELLGHPTRRGPPRRAARGTRRRRAARRRSRPSSASSAASARSRATAVHDLEERDGEVVGDDDAVEAPPLAQQAREVLGARGHRDAVDVGVGVHDRADAALDHGHLERREEDVRHLARAGGHRGVVAPGPRAGVADEVLERRVHAGALQPAHVGGADRADDVRVLGDALVDPAPAGVADDVEHRRQALVDAELPHRLTDRGGPSPRPARGRTTRPTPAGVGNVAAFHAASPVRHSSCTSAGMPRRVSRLSRRCSAHSHAARSAGSTGRVP